MTPAGFWVRALALLIDLVVIGIAEFLLGVVAALLWGPQTDGRWDYQGALGFFTLVFSAAYATVLHALFGQTIGKSLVGIRVVGVDGALLPVGAALLRYGGYYVSLLPFALGFVMAGLRRDKRALHDLIAGSRAEWLPREPRAGAPRGAAMPEPPPGEPAPPGEPDVLGVPPAPRETSIPGVSEDRPRG